MPTPFEGTRVLDLSDRLSGAFAARLFGDFGSDVILIEPPEGHPLRAEPPFVDQSGPDCSTLHNYANWNKQSVVATDGTQVDELVADADLVITTADPLETAWYASALEHLCPNAVHLSITAHGLNDPLSGRAGNNLTASARSGWSLVDGYSDEPPLQLPRNQSGYIGGVAGFIAATAALRRRDHGDTAELTDVSELKALALTVHPWAIADIYNDRGVSIGAGGRQPRGKQGPLYDVKDGRMSIGLREFHNWPEAMEVLGIPEFGQQEELIPREGRHSKDLTGVQAALAVTLPTLERWSLFNKLVELRCVAGVMQHMLDICEDRQLVSRDFLVDVNVSGNTARAAGAPAKLTPSPWQLNRPAPKLGEHNEAITIRDNRPSRPTMLIEPEDLSEGPLSGIRVLSFCQTWAGPFATELLALLGADVVQVSPPHRTDSFRRFSGRVPPGIADPNRKQHPQNTQGHYNSVNLNKRNVTIDVSQEKGMELLWRLLPRFDILADNFRPTVIPSWGVSLEKLHEMRPGMIWASLSGFGETGPYSTFPGNGVTIEPMSGIASINGYEEGPGMNTGGIYADPVSGYFLVAAIMAALAHRDLTGEAQRVDLSMMEALNVVCGDALLEATATNTVPGPSGNRHPRVAPHNNYLARGDDWLALATDSDEAWRQLAAYIGDPRLDDERFSTMAGRKAHETEVDELIGTWVRKQDAREAETALGRLGVSAARVRPLYDIYSQPDPDFKASGFISEVDHPETGPTWLPGRPWQFSSAPSAPVRPSPCLGQHSREVLWQELGITAAEYRSLVQDRVTGTLDEL